LIKETRRAVKREKEREREREREREDKKKDDERGRKKGTREGVSFLGEVEVPVRSRIKPRNVPSAFPEHIILKCDSFISREFEFIFMLLLVVGYNVSRKENIFCHCIVIKTK